MPYLVCIVPGVEMVVDGRPGHKDGIEDVVRPIDVGGAYDFHMPCLKLGGFHDDGRDVLEDVHAKDCLDDEHVAESFHGFDYPQIVDEAVVVEVQIRNQVGGIVQQGLELLNAV